MRTIWWSRAIAFLMGCLVGPYATGLSQPSVAVIAVSVLALALPALISVLIDWTFQRRAIAGLWVACVALVIGGLVIVSAAFPDFWQGYRNDAAFFSLLALTLLAPLAAAFAVGTNGASAINWERRAINTGLLAWLGIGVQNFLLPYVVPVVRGFFAILVLHAPLSHQGGFGALGLLLLPFIVLLLCLLYGLGCGLAGVAGWVGAALRLRLTSPRKPRAAHGPASSL